MSPSVRLSAIFVVFFTCVSEKPFWMLVFVHFFPWFFPQLCVVTIVRWLPFLSVFSTVRTYIGSICTAFLVCFIQFSMTSVTFWKK